MKTMQNHPADNVADNVEDNVADNVAVLTDFAE